MLPIGNSRPAPRSAACLSLVAAVLAPAVACSAPLLFAYDLGNDHLISFDATAPGVLVDDRPLTGLQPFEFLVGIDARPATGELYAVAVDFGNNGRVVTIDPATGAVAAVGGTTFPLTPRCGIDFNPVADRIRLVCGDEVSQRLNPTTGDVSSIDSPLAFVAGDVLDGNDPNVTHVAYTNNFAGATSTTLFGISNVVGINLVRIGGVGGTPSPNTGQVTTIGPLGLTGSIFGGFDIDPDSGTAYAALNIGGSPRLYLVDLTTGAATLVGTIGAGDLVVDGLAVVPEAGSCAAGLCALLALGCLRTRSNEV